MNKLGQLKVERDYIDAEIKLIEDGIRKAANDAEYARQLICFNEDRLMHGKRQLTMTEFMSGMFTEGSDNVD